MKWVGKMKKCENCGTLGEGIYCPECGGKMIEIEEKASSNNTQTNKPQIYSVEQNSFVGEENKEKDPIEEIVAEDSNKYDEASEKGEIGMFDEKDTKWNKLWKILSIISACVLFIIGIVNFDFIDLDYKILHVDFGFGWTLIWWLEAVCSLTLNMLFLQLLENVRILTKKNSAE